MSREAGAFGRLGRRARHLLEERSVVSLAWLLSRLPCGPAVEIGAVLGRWAFSLVRVRRRVTLENLAATLGREWSPRERARVGRRVYENFGRSMVEYCRLPVTNRRYVDEHVVYEGLEHLDAALGRGRGALLVGGHFGSWALMGACFTLRGYRLAYVAIEQHNPGVNRLKDELAEAVGVRFIKPGGGTRGILEALRRNEAVAVLADQDAGRGGVFVDFLGRPASVVRGPAAIALRTGAPLLPTYLVRERGPSHRLVILPPLAAPAARPARGEAEEQAVRELTRRHADALAAFVRRYPDQWFWPHRRWKTQP